MKKFLFHNAEKKLFKKRIHNTLYKFYAVYYPVGNGRFNMDKAVEDILYIIKENF